MLACLRHAPVRRGWVDTLSRGLRPLATFCDPFGIVALAHGKIQFFLCEIINRKSIELAAQLNVDFAI